VAVYLRVTSDDIAAVGAAVRKLGDGRTVVNEMAKEIRDAVPPVRAAARQHALAFLPKRGGLNAWVAAASVRAAVRRGPRSAGVSLVAGRNSRRRRADLDRLDRDGRLRHPLYGDRDFWYLQSVQPGWFTAAVVDHTDDFADAIADAVDTAARKVGL
jgi:hypothetical protein